MTNDEGRNIEDCVLAVKLSNDPPTLLSISDGKGIGVITSPNGKIGMEYCAAERTHLEIIRLVQFTRDSPDQTDFPEHGTLGDKSNYKVVPRTRHCPLTHSNSPLS